MCLSSVFVPSNIAPARAQHCPGVLEDLLWIFYRYGLPSEAGGNFFLFNGDIADRGKFSIEIFMLTLGPRWWGKAV